MDPRKKSVRNKQSVDVSHSLNKNKEILSSSAATTDTTPCSSSSTPSSESLPIPSPDLVKIPALDKYSLRPKSIKNRIEVELKRKAPVVKKTPKPKAKPVPLSKYRRRTANARERTRMQVKKFHSFHSRISVRKSAFWHLFSEHCSPSFFSQLMRRREGRKKHFISSETND